MSKVKARAKMNMHMRIAPKVNSKSISIIKKGSIVDVIDIREDGWMYIYDHKSKFCGFTSNVNGAYYSIGIVGGVEDDQRPKSIESENDRIKDILRFVVDMESKSEDNSEYEAVKEIRMYIESLM